VGALGGILGRELELASVVSFWGDDAFLVLAAAFAGALLWRTRSRAAVALVVLVLALTWLLAAFTPLCSWMADGLVRRDPVRSADAVFVLSSRLQEDGELTTSAMSRLLHGLELVGQSRAPRLVLSELPKRPSYAAQARRLLDHLKLPAELVVVGPVTNTRDEAVAVARLCRERGWGEVLLVTSPVHSRRASAAFEREGLRVISSPAMETRYDLERLDRPGERVTSFASILHERIGLWLYARRGWL
jgi:uncharacterized SAM-binding protein YcdF (DUF218 family)